MTDGKTEVVAAPSGDGKTADEMLVEIEAAQKQGQSVVPGEEAGKQEPGPKVPTTPDQVEPEPEDKPTEPEGISPSEEAPAPGEGDKAVGKLMKKKGFKSVRDLAHSYEHLERKLHQKGEEKEAPKAIEPSVVYPQQPPPYPYPPQSQPPQESPDDLSARYNMHRSDFDTFLRLSVDASNMVVDKRLKPLEERNAKLEKEIRRGRELRVLDSDPLSRDSEILEEMNKILEGDPSIFSNQQDPLIYAFNVAINNVGRKKILANSPLGEPKEPGGSGNDVPNAPPPMGKGSGGGTKGIKLTPQSQITPEKFASLSSAEQEKILRQHKVPFKRL